ncbi:cuticle protein 63-like [Argiope bruennichi]|uniref:cuticle protein 63-like n=1 Tax=Argiope bruennichi TaxID=94029 RepID=UPI0024948465|nr:cuticle protein 63-like [Argiope bruennichi]
MFAKIVIFCAALAAAHASLVGPYGWGAPVYGKALVAAPAVATVSTQKTAINHVAPAAPVAAAAPLAVATPYAAAPYAYGAGLVAGHGLAAPYAYGAGLVAGHGLAAPFVGAPYGLGVGKLGLGYGYGLGHGKAIW